MAFLEEYTLLDELGQGGYATVYKVRHNKLGYIRAIRVLNAIIAHGETDKTYQKFLEECRLLLRLGNGEYLAAQKQYSLTPVWFDAAYKRSKACRLGGFDDWRLPTEEELYTLFFVENFITSTTYFWIYHYVNML